MAVWRMRRSRDKAGAVGVNGWPVQRSSRPSGLTPQGKFGAMALAYALDVCKT